MDYKAEYERLLIQHQQLTEKYNKLLGLYKVVITKDRGETDAVQTLYK